MHLVKRALIPAAVALIALVPSVAAAASSPSLGAAATFGILAGTYTNTASGTTINGDLGYTTPPAVAPTVNGNTHAADSTYSQAGTDQGVALAGLNSQVCTFNFAPGAIDLATDATHGTPGSYGPGVYCITGAASVGGGGTITLTGSGTYIFRMTGALDTSANSVVAASGASPCNVWWTPGAGTTLGANSTFLGTDIDASGITIGNAITWTGRALAFGGTVSTDADTINVPSCSAAATATPTATPSTSGPTVPSTGAASSELGWWPVPVLVLLLGVTAVGVGVRRRR
jgi:hypothetical protein